MEQERLRCIHDHMKQRCSNKNNTVYHCYGGRGIKVCKEWQEYLPFKKWSLENGYKDNLQIDRINNDGDYAPDNCRWITITEQSRNRSTNVTYKGECSYDGSVRLGGNPRLISRRLRLGWTLEKAFTTPRITTHTGGRKKVGH